MRSILALLASTVLLSAPSVQAEEAVYGSVDLIGLARTSWPLNDIQIQGGMVCNVNGPDGFLTIRSCPSTSCASNRKLNRLAILDVDTYQWEGNWIRVVDAYRTHTKDGRRLDDYKPLPVTGWAHTGYICDFID